MKTVSVLEYIHYEMTRSYHSYKLSCFEKFLSIRGINVKFDKLSILDLQKELIAFESYAPRECLTIFGLKLSKAIPELLTIRIAKGYYYRNFWNAGYGFFFLCPHLTSTVWFSNQTEPTLTLNRKNKWVTHMHTNNEKLYASKRNCITMHFNTRKQVQKQLIADENKKIKRSKLRFLAKLKNEKDYMVRSIDCRLNNAEKEIGV